MAQARVAQYAVEMLKPQDITPRLGELWPHLGVMAKQSNGKVDELDLIELVANTTMQLWRVYDTNNNETMSYGLTEVIVYPKLKALCIEGISGQKLLLWKHLVHDVYAWGTMRGCTLLRIVGREAWVRVLAHEGFEKHEVVLERRIA